MAQNAYKNNYNEELNKHNHIFELFLFVNPIGNVCLRCEQEVTNFVKNTDKKVYIRFITCNNFQIFNDSLKHKENQPKNLVTRNEMFQSANGIAIGFKAAILQGRKNGRYLLMQMQQYFGREGHPYSRKEMIALAKQYKKLDIEMWLEDMDSPLTMDSLKKDQVLTKQMAIRTTPTLVIFDNLNNQYGVKIEQDFTQKMLEQVTDEMMQADKMPEIIDNKPKLKLLKSNQKPYNN